MVVDTGRRESYEMPSTDTEQRIAQHEQRYRELAAEIATIGLVHSGSVTRRSTRCGTPTCKCHAEPPQLHGPYYQWTAKINGKTVTRRLTETEAALYGEWIANDRRLRQLITQMRQVAAKAAELKLKQAASPQLPHRQTELNPPSTHKPPEPQTFPGSSPDPHTDLRLL
jgi:uncharacterized protein DUF6788